MKSAYVYLLSGDPTYAAPVKTELLSIISQVGLVWTNAARWCPYNGTANQLVDNDAFQTSPWISRLLKSYDYLIVGGYLSPGVSGGLTSAKRPTIEQWFYNAAVLWNTVTKGTITENAMSGAFNTVPNLTCDRGACPGTPRERRIWGANHARVVQRCLPIRLGHPEVHGAAIGILRADTELLRIATLWFQYEIRYAAFSGGQVVDQNRWNGSTPQDSWGHTWSMLSNLIGTADVIGRTGDTSLFTYQSPGGLFGTGGGNIGLQGILLHYARLTNKTLLEYGTTSAAQLNAAHLLSWDTESPTHWDFMNMVTNMYFVDAEITTAVTRNQGTTISSCGDGQYGCFNGLYASWPDLPFMYGNMAGVVNPYSLAPASPVVPRLLRVIR